MTDLSIFGNRLQRIVLENQDHFFETDRVGFEIHISVQPVPTKQPFYFGLTPAGPVDYLGDGSQIGVRIRIRFLQISYRYPLSITT